MKVELKEVEEKKRLSGIGLKSIGELVLNEKQLLEYFRAKQAWGSGGLGLTFPWMRWSQTVIQR